jgi:hypothetical protein
MVNYSCRDHEYYNSVCIYCGFIEGEEEEVDNKIMKEKPTNTWELAEILEQIAKLLKEEHTKQQDIAKLLLILKNDEKGTSDEGQIIKDTLNELQNDRHSFPSQIVEDFNISWTEARWFLIYYLKNYIHLKELEKRRI